jgi:hypothetical protein
MKEIQNNIESEVRCFGHIQRLEEHRIPERLETKMSEEDTGADQAHEGQIKLRET